MKLELTKQEVELILIALGELPAKVSFQLIKKIEAETIKEDKKEE